MLKNPAEGADQRPSHNESVIGKSLKRMWGTRLGRVFLVGFLSLMLGAMYGWVGLGVSILLVVILSVAAPLHPATNKVRSPAKHPGARKDRTNPTKAPSWWNELDRKDLPVDGTARKGRGDRPWSDGNW